jgi:hypothetical protein
MSSLIAKICKLWLMLISDAYGKGTSSVKGPL